MSKRPSEDLTSSMWGVNVVFRKDFEGLLDGIPMAATIRVINPYVKFVESESCFSTEDGRLTFSLALLLLVCQLG